MRLLYLLLICGMSIGASQASQWPAVFDVQIHYSHDAWDSIPPDEAIRRLREAGITRAMVSSSSDEGTIRLYQLAPDLIIPALRPYQKRRDLQHWMYQEESIPFMESRLAQYPYAAIGEIHLNYFDETDLPVVRKTIQLVQEHNLLLHIHADAMALERIYAQAPDIKILWAHAGFEPALKVREMMERHKNLWADLSFRWAIFKDGQFRTHWRELLIEHSDRFMVSVDTYTPKRWAEIRTSLDWYESMFAQLPRKVARRIRYDNAQRVILRHFHPD